MNTTRIGPDLLRRYIPILSWGAEYSGRALGNDLIAAAIITIMLIPQSLAYALLVGLPPQVGLYASMAPLVLYAIFRYLARARGRPRRRGQPLDRGRGGAGRVPGNTGVSGGSHCAGHGVGFAAAGHGDAAAGVWRAARSTPRGCSNAQIGAE